MSDISVLRVLSTHDNYKRFRRFIKDHVVSAEIRQIIKDMHDYYDSISTDEIDPDEFSTWFKHVRHAGMKPERMRAYDLIFNKWIDEVASGESVLVDAIIEKYIKLDYFTRVLNLSMEGAEERGTVSIGDIEDVIDQYKGELKTTTASDPSEIDEDEVAGKLSEHIEDTSAGDGLEWRLEELNVSLGPLRKGDFVEIAAYVDSGKTSFLMSEATFMAPQLEDDEYVIWVNNEERGGKLYSRLYQSALGQPESILLSDLPRYEEEYDSYMGMENRIRIKDNPSLSVHDLEAYFERVQPKLIIIDMLDKVKGFETEARDDIRLQKLYQWAREMAKKYGPVIAASQVEGGGANQKWIRMEQLSGSRVAKQSEADAIITIGRIEEDSPATANNRYIHIPKNKLPGGPRSEESERNGHWEVEIVPLIARYRSKLS